MLWSVHQLSELHAYERGIGNAINLEPSQSGLVGPALSLVASISLCALALMLMITMLATVSWLKTSLMKALHYDQRSIASVKRFLLKLGLISLFAIVQISTSWGIFKALVVLTLSSAMISMFTALSFREPFTHKQFNYWDETLIFAALALAAGMMIL